MKRSTVVAVLVVALMVLASEVAFAQEYEYPPVVTPTFHRCTVSIERTTPDELTLELWSTSQSTTYSVDINYSSDPCNPWDGHEENWIVREELPPGFYTLPWAEFYDENPTLGMEACINWTCQPEVVVIYWSQDYQVVLDYWYLPLIRSRW